MRQRNRSKWVQLSEKGTVPLESRFKTSCCDCGLVHLWVLRDNGKSGDKSGFVFDINVDKRSTAQIRRLMRKRTAAKGEVQP